MSSAADGGFLIADTDTGNNRIRLVTTSGLIFTVAGGAEAGFAGDRGAASGALLTGPSSVAPIIGGGYLIADTGNNRIRRVDATGTITTVAGTGAPGAAGDGGPSTAAEVNLPQGVAITPDGAVFIGDTGNHKVREIDTAGTMTTATGTGTPGFSGDGGLPTAAQFNGPLGVPAANGLEPAAPSWSSTRPTRTGRRPAPTPRRAAS